jgi:hypothetical protein
MEKKQFCLSLCIRIGLILKTCKRKTLVMTKSLGVMKILRLRKREKIGGRTSDARRRKRRKELSKEMRISLVGQKPTE